MAQSSFEAFHHRIVSRLAWSAEVKLNASLICPFIHHLTDELAAIIGFDRHRFASDRHDIVQNPNDIFAFSTLINVYIKTFSGVAVNHSEHSKLASIKQVICNKVHTPDLIYMQRQLLRLSNLSCLVALRTLLPK
jgi:hypothetical protein